jgi:flagellar biosynthesis/type III secretory pathway M-ring protein FliF/YscJ
MKKPSPQLVAVFSLFIVVCALAVPAVRADEKSEAAATRKAQREAETLKKYDANHDGKLDDTEKAVRKADKEKAKAERAEKKKERVEKKAEDEQK